jgi:hypothetical protein
MMADDGSEGLLFLNIESDIGSPHWGVQQNMVFGDRGLFVTEMMWPALILVELHDMLWLYPVLV